MAALKSRSSWTSLSWRAPLSVFFALFFALFALLAVIGAAVFASTRPDGFDRLGAGALAGAFLGGCVGLLAHTLVGAALRHDTEAAFQSLVIGFAAKFAGAVLPWLALTFLPQAQPLADPIAYLVAYAAAVLLVLGGGLFDHLRLSAEVAAASGADAAGASETTPGSSHTLESAS